VLEIDEGNAVTIKQIELSIVSRAWDEGWIVAQPPAARTGRTVAVVGSGPSGLAAAQQLNRRGHSVTLFERDEAAGGLLRFGVPDFKIEKHVVERRVQQLVDEGVDLVLRTEPSAEDLERFDAVVLCTGSRVPRDLPVPGRELEGVHFAMEYLYTRNRAIASDRPGAITATGKHVIVIGGGDTGADCVASAHREGAAGVTQIELLGEPPAKRDDSLTPWPLWPVKLRSSYALAEGGERSFAISTTHLSGDGRVERIHWVQNMGAPPFEAIPGTEHSQPADLVLLAMGFTGPEQPLLQELGVELSRDGYATSKPNVFAAGDCRRGQSLIVWAIEEGRKAAEAVDAYLGDGASVERGAFRNAAA
jgi:glutamate synthase (NADPH/NADH) small chain